VVVCRISLINGSVGHHGRDTAEELNLGRRFIASGAFHGAKPSDLLAELQGRLPIRVELKPLTEKDMYTILTEPENNLVKQQSALMFTEGVQLEFTGARPNARAPQRTRAAAARGRRAPSPTADGRSFPRPQTTPSGRWPTSRPRSTATSRTSARAGCTRSWSG
jgi:hypothetical protein